MTDRRRPDVMSSLPSTRPQRRSAKRAVTGEASAGGASAKARPAAAAKKSAVTTKKTAAAKKPTAATRTTTAAKKPAAQRPPAPVPEPAPTPGALGTAVQAGFELGEIGLRIGVRTLRAALSRVPRP